MNVTVNRPAFDAAPTMAAPFQERPGGSPVTDASFHPSAADTSTPRSASVHCVFIPPAGVYGESVDVSSPAISPASTAAVEFGATTLTVFETLLPARFFAVIFAVYTPGFSFEASVTFSRYLSSESGTFTRPIPAGWPFTATDGKDSESASTDISRSGSPSTYQSASGATDSSGAASADDFAKTALTETGSAPMVNDTLG